MGIRSASVGGMLMEKIPWPESFKGPREPVFFIMEILVEPPSTMETSVHNEERS